MCWIIRDKSSPAYSRYRVWDGDGGELVGVEGPVTDAGHRVWDGDGGELVGVEGDVTDASYFHSATILLGISTSLVQAGAPAALPSVS